MSAPSREGEVIDGKYRILRKLGEGGMGAVYAGEHMRLKRTVAIKLLHGAASAQADMADRFEREAQAAAQIGNDHIVEVYDIGATAQGERFMVMEYLEGESLRTKLRRERRLSVSETASLCDQLLLGLGAAHNAGIIHRDLKPDNIFVLREKAGRANFVKVLDFGISKFTQLGDSGSTTRTGTIMGSPNYMSPEHVQAANQVDARSDLYSVGILLFEAVTGVIPRKGSTFAELLFKVVYEPIPDPRTVLPDLDPNFAAVINKACAQRPEDRYATATELRQVLSAFASSAPAKFADGASTIALGGEQATAILTPAPGAASHPSFGNAPGPSPSGAFGAGSQPQFATGPQPQFGNGSQPQFGNGSQPQFGAGSQPQFGNGSQPQFGNGSQPQFGNGSQPSVASPFTVTQGSEGRRGLGIPVAIGIAALLGVAGAVFFATQMGSPHPSAAAGGAPATSALVVAPSSAAEPEATAPSSEPSGDAQSSAAPVGDAASREPSATAEATAAPVGSPPVRPITRPVVKPVQGGDPGILPGY